MAMMKYLMSKWNGVVEIWLMVVDRYPLEQSMFQPIRTART